MRPFLVLTLLLTAVSCNTDQCDTFRRKAHHCYQDVFHDAGLSAANDKFKTKHAVCCYTHILLDCMEEAATATSCHLDIKDEASNDLLLKYIRMRCDKYNECSSARGHTAHLALVLLASLFTILLTFLHSFSDI